MNTELGDFFQICKDNGLKVTPQRSAVYTALMGSTEHPTADMVYQAVKKDFPGISLDTVNRTLATFSQIGIVEVLESPGSIRRFEPDLTTHHHFICLKCGKIIDIEGSMPSGFPTPESIENELFVVTGMRVVFRGYCKACAEKIS